MKFSEKKSKRDRVAVLMFPICLLAECKNILREKFAVDDAAERVDCFQRSC